MIELRPFTTLGGENHGWLDARHHFSFAGYHGRRRCGGGQSRQYLAGWRSHCGPVAVKRTVPDKGATHGKGLQE